MANEEHVERLLAGVKGWNQWRGGRLMVGLDLSRADLNGAKLKGVSLSFANLSQANLSQADLRGASLNFADLSGADLSGAYLNRANLSQADLNRADLNRIFLDRANLSRTNLSQAVLSQADLSQAVLSQADLSGANLSQADLSFANLSQANLSGADLSSAIFDSTVVGAVDLRNVHGLETVYHRGPSTIGLDTIERSQGWIPKIFLRGCGVSDRLIEYIPSLTAQPIQYYSTFISYSSHDEALAERLHADLQARGVRCWFAPHSLTPGEVIIRGIDEAIRVHDKLVLLLSESAINSHWVEFEVDVACNRELNEGRTVLYPVRLDDTVLMTPHGWAASLRRRHIGDFRQWKDHDAYQAAFTRLLRDLHATPDP